MTTTNSERVAKSRAALVARGGKRIPTGWLQPAEAQALDLLVATGYGVSPVHAISRALVDAAKREKAKVCVDATGAGKSDTSNTGL